MSDDGPRWSMHFPGSPFLPDSPGSAGGSDDDRLLLSDLGKLLRRGRRHVVGAARAGDRPTVGGLLRDHLGGAVDDLEVVEESWPGYDHVNVQVALDAWLRQPGREHELVGLTDVGHREFGLSDLLRHDVTRYGPFPGNVAWMNLTSGPGGQVVPAVRSGIFLVREGEARTAVMIVGPNPEMGSGNVRAHLVSDQAGAAARAATDIRRLAVEHNVFRGQVISFGGDLFGERETVLRFLGRPALSADQVVLPEQTLAMIRRQVVGVAEHRAQLLAARQHLKRGLLLYGPPGVGKSHTVRYLTSQLTDTTIIVLTGDALGMIGTACSVARTLQPAMIVVEDVDLIAEDRDMYDGGQPLLFSLLNEMDGLAEDADVVFLLTTNRAGVLERALAARPGRVDQAVALELPDADARRRLFELYRGDLHVDQSRLDAVIERTEHVTASFLKELLRRAALIAADAGTDAGNGAGSDPGTGPGTGGTPPAGSAAPLRVTADQLDAALDELFDTRNAMTRVLLGGARPGERVAPDDPDEDDDDPEEELDEAGEEGGAGSGRRERW